MLFVIALIASALITAECGSEAHSANDWISLRTHGKMCDDTDSAAGKVSPVTPEACQAYCKTHHKRFTVWKRIICADKNQVCPSLANDCQGHNAAIRDMCPLTCGLCTVDPCMECSTKATCRAGKCYCKRGYRGDGKTCTADPCSLCHAHAHCSSGQCVCNTGYIGDGHTCRANPCSLCHAHAHCKSGKCICNSGYVGDGHSCRVDPCTKCSAHATCRNEQCFCKKGFKGNGYTCNRSVRTFGGTVPWGSYCVFPFRYRGKVYHDCVLEPEAAHGGRPWCPTRANHHNLEWGNCVGKQYEGKWDREHGGYGYIVANRHGQGYEWARGNQHEWDPNHY